jgi:transcription initiation factor TFIID subunit 9B
MAVQAKHIPKDAQVIMSIMKDMGIHEYEPRVINQLLEFTYRKYVKRKGYVYNK